MSNQEERCDIIHCCIINRVENNVSKIEKWFPKGVRVCDFVAQITNIVERSPIILIHESTNKSLSGKMTVTLESVGLTEGQNNFFVRDPPPNWSDVPSNDALNHEVSASPTNPPSVPKIVDPESTNVCQESDRLDDKSELPLDDKPQLLLDDKPELQLDDQPKLLLDDKPKLQIDDKPKSNLDDQPRLPLDDKPTLQVDDKPKLHPDDQPKLHLDVKLKLQLDDQPKSHLDDERKVHLENVIKSSNNQSNELLASMIDSDSRNPSSLVTQGCQPQVSFSEQKTDSEQINECSSADDELGLGASASPTSSSSIPIPLGYDRHPVRPLTPPSSLNTEEGSRKQIQRWDPSTSSAHSSSSRRTGYVGLVNQAMTCYLNSLLQALYMTPEFRNALYSWEFDVNSSKQDKSIPYQLQKLFLNLQTSSKSAVETTDLTHSFGWDSSEAWQQHDIQELCRVMFDALEQKFEGTQQANLINKLYQGKMIDYVKCLECGKEKQREDTFLDIPLPIRPFGATSAYSSIEEALRGFVKPETLDGNNQYFCEGCGKKCDAHKGLKFTQFPYLLTFHLMRFDFDYKTMHRIKLNDRVTFPEILHLDHFFEDDSPAEKETLVNGEKNDDNSTADSGSALDDDSCLPSVESTLPTPSQEMDQDSDEGIEVSCVSNGATKDTQSRNVYELFSIMIHSGSASGGHYYAYIKDFSTQKWFCFNDQSVTPLMPEDIEKTFGGGSTHAYYSGAYSSSTNAYMLMYRLIDKENNAFAMSVDEFPPHLKKLYEHLEEEKERSLKLYDHGDEKERLDGVKKFTLEPAREYRRNRLKARTGVTGEDSSWSSMEARSDLLGERPAEKSDVRTMMDMDKWYSEQPNAKLDEINEKVMQFKMEWEKQSDSTKYSDQALPDSKSGEFNVKLLFYYSISHTNPYAYNAFRREFSFSPYDSFSLLVDEVHEEMKTIDPGVERSQLSIYLKKHEKLDCLLEGAEDDTIASVLSKHGSPRKLYHVTARAGDSKLDSLLLSPKNEKYAVHRVDLMEKEVKQSRPIFCPPSLIVEHFKAGLRAEFNVPEDVKVIIAIENQNKKGGKLRKMERRSMSLNVKPTELKFLTNDKATLMQEGVLVSYPVYVSFIVSSISDMSAMRQMFELVDSDKNSVSVTFTLPDVGPIILERLSIPSLKEEKEKEEKAKAAIALEKKAKEEVVQQPPREITKSHELKIYTDRDNNSSGPKGDASSGGLSIDSGGGGGAIDPGGNSAVTCSGDGGFGGKACSSVPALENIEEEQVHFSDQSASEESSLTDSERTIIGDVPDDCPMSSASNSPDTSLHLGQDLMSNSLSNVIDKPSVNSLSNSSEDKEDWNEDNSIILSSKDCPATSFMCREIKSKHPDKQLFVDKRMPFETLLEHLEPLVGVSSKYFKIYTTHKNYEIKDEYDFVRYSKVFVIKLEPHLNFGEFRCKVYFLSYNLVAGFDYLFEWIVKKGELVGDTKKAMLKEFERIKDYEIPFRCARLRRKTSELADIFLDDQRWGDDISLLKTESFILQELSAPEIKTNTEQMVVCVRPWNPSYGVQGQFDEILLEENATRTTLIEEISKLKGIPPEHIDVARSPYTFPQSISLVQVSSDESLELPEPQWNDTTENLQESSLRIARDGPVLLYRDKREEHNSQTSRFSSNPKKALRIARCQEVEDESTEYDGDNSGYSKNIRNFRRRDNSDNTRFLRLEEQNVKRRNSERTRKEKGLKIYLGSPPISSVANFQINSPKYPQECSSGEMED